MTNNRKMCKKFQSTLVNATVRSFYLNPCCWMFFWELDFVYFTALLFDIDDLNTKDSWLVGQASKTKSSLCQSFEPMSSQ